jgi:hypothetical protein
MQRFLFGYCLSDVLLTQVMSSHIASISERWIDKDIEGSGYGPI